MQSSQKIESVFESLLKYCKDSKNDYLTELATKTSFQKIELTLGKNQDSSIEFYKNKLYSLRVIVKLSKSTSFSDVTGILISDDSCLIHESEVNISLKDKTVELIGKPDTVSKITESHLIKIDKLKFIIAKLDQNVAQNIGWITLSELSRLNENYSINFLMQDAYRPFYLQSCSDLKFFLDQIMDPKSHLFNLNDISLFLTNEIISDETAILFTNTFEEFPKKLTSVSLKLNLYINYRDISVKNLEKIFYSVLNKLQMTFRYTKQPKVNHLITTYEIWCEIDFFATNAKSLNFEISSKNPFENMLESTKLIIGEKYKDAIQFFEVLVENYKESTEVSHGMNLMNLGKVYHLYDEYIKAEESFKLASEIFKNKLPENHIFQGICRDNIAGVQFVMSRYKDSAENYEYSISLKKTILKTNHITLAYSYSNISEIYSIDRNFIKSEEYLILAKKILDNLSRESLIHAFYYSKLAFDLSNQNKHKESMKNQLRCLEIRKKVFSDTHVFVADSNYNIAREYRYLKEYDLSVKHCHIALEIYSKVYGPQSKAVADSYHSLGITYAEKADEDSVQLSLDFYQKSAKIKKTLYGNKVSDLGDSYYNIAIIFENKKDYQKAIKFYTKASKVYMMSVGSYSKDLFDAYRSIGRMYQEIVEYQKALDLGYMKAFSIIEMSYGQKHERTSLLMRDISTLYRKSEIFDVGFSFMLKSLEIELEISGPKHENTAYVYFELAIICMLMKKISDGIKYYRKVVDIGLSNHDGKGDIMSANAIYNIGNSFYRQGIPVCAKEFFLRSKMIYKILPNSESDVSDADRTVSNYDKLNVLTKVMDVDV